MFAPPADRYDTDVTDERKPAEPVRVVDRRWWARGDADDPSDPGEARKPTYVEELERRLTERAEELHTYANEHRRSLDEFEQIRVRMRRDVSREVERGKRAVLTSMLDVLDNLDRAIAAAKEGGNAPDDGLIRGVELVREQFLSTLGGFGITRLQSLSQPFDATRHEAVTTVIMTDRAEDGSVTAVLREGYVIGEDVLRPASVVVGKLADA